MADLTESQEEKRYQDNWALYCTLKEEEEQKYAARILQMRDPMTALRYYNAHDSPRWSNLFAGLTQWGSLLKAPATPTMSELWRHYCKTRKDRVPAIEAFCDWVEQEKIPVRVVCDELFTHAKVCDRDERADFLNTFAAKRPLETNKLKARFQNKRRRVA
jgi:hypothetical protein